MADTGLEETAARTAGFFPDVLLKANVGDSKGPWRACYTEKNLLRFVLSFAPRAWLVSKRDQRSLFHLQE
jgi:hypothetical protein